MPKEEKIKIKYGKQDKPKYTPKKASLVKKKGGKK